MRHYWRLGFDWLKFIWSENNKIAPSDGSPGGTNGGRSVNRIPVRQMKSVELLENWGEGEGVEGTRYASYLYSGGGGGKEHIYIGDDNGDPLGNMTILASVLKAQKNVT